MEYKTLHLCVQAYSACLSVSHKSTTIAEHEAWRVAALFGSSFLTSQTVGRMAVCFCICLFASPLASLRTVVQQQSTSSIPVPFTVASILNCFLWTVSGLLDLHDMNVIIPNVLGLLFGLVQAGLISFYGYGQTNRHNSAYSVLTP